MPMGLSWAPFIAQASSWTMLAFRQPGSYKLFDIQMSPGSFAVLLDREGVERGFATLVYDNLFIAMYSDIPSEVAAYLTRDVDEHLVSVSRHFGVVYKELLRYSVAGKFNLLDKRRDRAGKRVPDEQWTNPIFLGVEIDLLNDSQFQWRHSPKFMSKVKSTICNGGIPATPRTVARVVGLIVWDSIISVKRLTDLQWLIEPLRHFHIVFKKDWDKPCASPDLSWNSSSQKLQQSIADNQWKSHRLPLSHFSIFAASDASDDKGAGLIVRNNSTDISEEDFFSYPELPTRHIFIKEALAVHNVCSFILRKEKGSCFTIHLALDNIPVRRAFENGFSSNDVVNDVIRRTLALLDA